jgi:hypothetical protein
MNGRVTHSHPNFGVWIAPEQRTSPNSLLVQPGREYRQRTSNGHCRKRPDGAPKGNTILTPVRAGLPRVTACLVQMSGCHGSSAHRSCHHLVEQAESLTLADLQIPLEIAALSGALAVSERTLRVAFHRMRGLPPPRCLRMLKSSLARPALTLAGSRSEIVTEMQPVLAFAI